MFQSDEPWPFWKMKTMIPYAAPSEMRLRIAALIAQHDRAERARQQDEREDEDEREDVREVPVDGVDEVAVDGQRPAECRVRAPRARSLTRLMMSWIPGAAPSIVGNASIKRVAALASQARRRGRADDAATTRSLRGDRRSGSGHRSRRA